MSRSSPGVRRVVAILNFFSDHPGQAFTLTDLVRALKLSRATCHGLLTGLVEAGYLYRTSDKAYVLGPALLYIGEVAKAHFSPLQVAQPEMRALADAYDAVCSASFREGHDVVLRERAAAVSHLGYSAPRGTRLPLLPQFAGLFFAWAPTAELDAWLAGITPAPTHEQRTALDNSISFIRQHGFHVGLHNGEAETRLESKRWLHESDYRGAPLLPITTLAPDASYAVQWINAPVLGPDRKVAFVVGVQGLDAELTGTRVAEIGRHMREVCDRIGTFMARPAERNPGDAESDAHD